MPVTLYAALLLILQFISLTAMADTVRLDNGQWFDGADFRPGTKYVVDGLLTSVAPERVDTVIDLGNGFVLPPFADTHTHRANHPSQTPGEISRFLGSGIFYIMNQGSLVRYSDSVKAQVNTPTSFDAIFAKAIISSPLSHAVDLWQGIVERGVYPDMRVEDLDGEGFLIIESQTQLYERWPSYLATQPDIVKVMLEYSEEYERRHKNPSFFGQSGLNPQLMDDIVTLAREAGLRVSAHVETAYDFEVAVAAGVDIIAHLPGYDVPSEQDIDRYRISEADAALAARNETIVITTTLLSVDRAENEPQRLLRMNENHKRNLELLKQAGVTIAAGSDLFSKDVVDEVFNLASLNVFSNGELLTMLCNISPKVVFPDRLIGSLDEGHEASFLVLGKNPLEDINALRDIRLAFKNGVQLDRK